MNPAADPSLLLAQRLRSLRLQAWPGKRITQGRLAEAMAVSVPLISSWERAINPVVPPRLRLEAYATFFATERSVERTPFRLLGLSQLTDEEKERRASLVRELVGLRDRTQAEGMAIVSSFLPDNLWHFPADQDITIVCSELPKNKLERLPNSHPEDRDYVKLYQYPDLDALLELFGHIRAVNPNNNVNIRGASKLSGDDYTSHLVLLGGVDWNEVTAHVLDRQELPVRQLPRDKDSDSGAFEVTDGGKKKVFTPVLRSVDGCQLLVEDVAHFYRSPSPFNKERTVTICNGMHGRGTYGAVRTLTDFRFRDRNNEFVRTRFAGKDTFSIISRVHVQKGIVVTPDWTDTDMLLHDWSVETT